MQARHLVDDNNAGARAGAIKVMRAIPIGHRQPLKSRYFQAPAHVDV
jgi:hypothetical protein